MKYFIVIDLVIKYSWSRVGSFARNVDFIAFHWVKIKEEVCCLSSRGHNISNILITYLFQSYCLFLFILFSWQFYVYLCLQSMNRVHMQYHALFHNYVMSFSQILILIIFLLLILFGRIILFICFQVLLQSHLNCLNLLPK